MTSHWSCIFGNGCQGVLTEEAPELVHGCCSYGAHASGPKDQALVNKAAKLLDDDTWQFRKRAKKKGIWVKVAKDDYRTRLVDGACIFLNRPGFATGPGCALHQLAERTGQHHSDLKPEVCWQLPLRNIEEYDEDADDGIVYHRLTEFARHGWGEGGEEFAWWCTEEPAAFVGREMVYRNLEPELRKMCGDRLFEMIAEYLDERLATGPRRSATRPSARSCSARPAPRAAPEPTSLTAMADDATAELVADLAAEQDALVAVLEPIAPERLVPPDAGLELGRPRHRRAPRRHRRARGRHVHRRPARAGRGRGPLRVVRGPHAARRAPRPSAQRRGGPRVVEARRSSRSARCSASSTRRCACPGGSACARRRSSPPG